MKNISTTRMKIGGIRGLISRLAMFSFSNIDKRRFSHHKLHTVIADTQSIHRLFVALKFFDLRETKRVGSLAHLLDAFNDSLLFLKREARKLFLGGSMKEVIKHAGNYLRVFSLALSRFSISPDGIHEFFLSASRILRSVCRISSDVEISVISTISIKSLSISLETKDEGATKPRKFLSSMIVMGDLFMDAIVSKRFCLSTRESQIFRCKSGLFQIWRDKRNPCFSRVVHKMRAEMPRMVYRAATSTSTVPQRVVSLSGIFSLFAARSSKYNSIASRAIKRASSMVAP